MAVLKEVLALFDLEVRGADKMDAAERTTARLESTLGKLGAALTASAIVGGMVALTERVVHQTRELDLNARRLGITTAQMQALSLASADAGMDLDAMTDAMSTLQERMRDAVQDPKSDPAVQLRALGVQIPRTMAEMPDAVTLLGQAADGLQNMGNQTDRVGAAMTVFGDVGRELLPVLQQGSGFIAAYTAELDALGGGFSTNVVEAAREAAAAQARLDLVTDSLTSRIAVFLIPTLTRSLEAVVSLAGGLNRLADRSYIVQATMLTLGGIAAAAAVATLIAWAPVILTVGFVAAVFAGVVLVVDDLLALMNGGRSVIGEFVEELMGAGAAAELALFLSEAWWAVSNAAGAAARAIQRALGQDTAQAEEAAQAEARAQNERRRQLRAQITGARLQARIDAAGPNATAAEERNSTGGSGNRFLQAPIGQYGDDRPGMRRLRQLAAARLARTNPGAGARLGAGLGLQIQAEAARASGGGTTVNAQTSITNNVTATDPRAVVRELDRAQRRGQDRQARQVRSALPRGGG